MNNLQSTFLILSASFSSTSCCSSAGITFKIVAFQLESSCLCYCVHWRKRKLAVFFPPSVTPSVTPLCRIVTEFWSNCLRLYSDRNGFLLTCRGIFIVFPCTPRTLLECFPCFYGRWSSTCCTCNFHWFLRRRNGQNIITVFKYCLTFESCFTSEITEVTFRVACDHTLSLCLYNLFSGGGALFFFPLEPKKQKSKK